MRTTKSCLSLGIATLIAILFAAPTRSFADTYQIYNLGSDQGYFFGGMNDSGNVVIDHSGGYACGFSTCYDTFLDGVSTGISTTTPAFTDDNGTPCKPNDPGGTVLHGVCNNGLSAFTGTTVSNQFFPGVYVGPSLQDLLSFGGGGLIYMNSLGDIVFDNYFTEDWYEAIDLSTPTPSFLQDTNLPAVTPEPAGILLLGTGLFALAILLRRRPFSHN